MFSPCVPSRKVVSYNSVGSMVISKQAFIKKLGYYPGSEEKSNQEEVKKGYRWETVKDINQLYELLKLNSLFTGGV